MPVARFHPRPPAPQGRSNPLSSATSEQAAYRLLRLFMPLQKSQSGLIPLLLLSQTGPCSALDSGLGTRQRRRAAICLHNLFTPLAEKTSSAATLLLLSNPNPLPWASGLFFYLRTLHFYTSPTAGQSDLITYNIDSKISHAN